MIISTGIATLADIDAAVQACRRVGNHDITLLKCTSSYPAPVEEANLLTMPNMKQTFGVEVGLSDHTLGEAVAMAATALGASVIEKHFILDRAVGGPDASFSMTPDEFAHMVEGIRQVEAALGEVSYHLNDKTMRNRRFARSLFVCEDMKAGDAFTSRNVRSVRPADGLPPVHLPSLLGRRASQDIQAGTPLAWSLVS